MGIEDDAFQVCVQIRISIWPLVCQLLNESHCMHHIRTVQTEVRSKTQDVNNARSVSQIFFFYEYLL